MFNSILRGKEKYLPIAWKKKLQLFLAYLYGIWIQHQIIHLADLEAKKNVTSFFFIFYWFEFCCCCEFLLFICLKEFFTRARLLDKFWDVFFLNFWNVLSSIFPFLSSINLPHKSIIPAYVKWVRVGNLSSSLSTRSSISCNSLKNLSTSSGLSSLLCLLYSFLFHLS